MTSWLIIRVKHVLSIKNEIKKDGLDGDSNSRPVIVFTMMV